jgi:hypothetical protein
MLKAHRRFTDVTGAYQRHLERRRGRARAPTGFPTEESGGVVVAAVVGAEKHREAFEACSAASRAISAAADFAAATETACALLSAGGPCSDSDKEVRDATSASAAATRQLAVEAAEKASAAVLAVCSAISDSGSAQLDVSVGADAVLSSDASAAETSVSAADILNDEATVGCIPGIASAATGAKTRTAVKTKKSSSPRRAAVSSTAGAGAGVGAAVLIHPVRRLIEELHDIPEMLEEDPGTVLEARNIYRIGLLPSLRYERNVLCAMCYVLCAVCYVLCAMCYVLCAMCYVLCAMC